MRKQRHKSFKELVNENKRELLQDREAMERLEQKWEEKHSKQA
ncbi:hypothetical protein A374_04804 [Fictibacillus macauensis ZFHKF-1]|uniref:FbpB family small basic protein n=1 Tax=Fictibacillus macauensis ZFHKF-1 TaxID=1196324 RepID=I8UJ01_9BACL|nr:FbpB family small basic protein [Fictibacillus macauensis]EIT86865.1 hypothetical protein A374_04804 [Fictibacillus macauensis ZFHKF-1]